MSTGAPPILTKLSLTQDIPRTNASADRNAWGDAPYPPCPTPTPEELRSIEVLVNSLFSIALALGLPGSALTLVTIRKSLVPTPFKIYLCILSFSDFISLVLSSLVTYKSRDHDSLDLQTMVTIALSAIIFLSFSHWTLALICMERLFPFGSQRRHAGFTEPKRFFSAL